MALALIGVLVVISGGHIDTLQAVRFAALDAWMLAAAVSWAAY